MPVASATFAAGLWLAGSAVPTAAQSPVAITSVSREQLERLPAGRRLDDLLRTCPSQTIPAISRPPVLPAMPPPGLSLQCMRPDNLELITVYRAHNQLRAQFGSRPLFWDPQLAAQARSYGPTLAGYGRPVHSVRTGREWSRENLLQALPGTSADRMVNVWVAERRYFRPGVFPNVSVTGNWADVGHFTQMVWPTTTAVGCAVQRGIGRSDWLICRYAPPGNRDGAWLGPSPPPPPPPPPP